MRLFVAGATTHVARDPSRWRGSVSRGEVRELARERGVVRANVVRGENCVAVEATRDDEQLEVDHVLGERSAVEDVAGLVAREAGSSRLAEVRRVDVENV